MQIKPRTENVKKSKFHLQTVRLQIHFGHRYGELIKESQFFLFQLNSLEIQLKFTLFWKRFYTILFRFISKCSK